MSAIVNILNKVDRFLSGSMKTIIIAVIIMATLTMFLQVISRYVFQVAISGLDELAGHTAVWLYLMGAAYGTYERTHIKADMMHLFVKNPRVLQVIRAAAAAVSVVISCYMTTWAFGYIKWSILKHEVTPTLRLPTVIFQLPILIGAFLMVVYFLREFIDILRRGPQVTPVSEQEG
jgi:TRAP-type C4-dicarboxylate transport system permease small subunit